MKNWHIRSSLLGAILFSSLSPAYGQDVGPECRGVAAGVVAAMRSSGEIRTQEASEAAVVAARRACAAALEGGLSNATDNVDTTETKETKQVSANKNEPSLWEMLTRDVEKKPGNKRLRGLKQ